MEETKKRNKSAVIDLADISDLDTTATDLAQRRISLQSKKKGANISFWEEGHGQ